MKYLSYVLKTKKYYVSVLVHTLLCIVVLFCFFAIGEKVFDAYDTFSSCTASAVAFDPYRENTDSFASFKDTVIVSLSQEEGEGLNVHTYQFLSDCDYTDKSILNENIVCEGQFYVLQKDEIALPKSIVEENKIAIGQNVYVGGVPCALKYVFEDVYQIVSADFSVKQTIAFVGVDTLKKNECVEYCNFDLSDGMHRQIKSITAVRKKLRVERDSIIGSVAVISIVLSLVNFIFRRKDEIASFKRNRCSGDLKTAINIALVESAFFIPVLAVTAICAVACKMNVLLLMSIILPTVAFWLITIVIMSVKVSR